MKLASTGGERLRPSNIGRLEERRAVKLDELRKRLRESPLEPPEQSSKPEWECSLCNDTGFIRDIPNGTTEACKCKTKKAWAYHLKLKPGHPAYVVTTPYGSIEIPATEAWEASREKIANNGVTYLGRIAFGASGWDLANHGERAPFVRIAVQIIRHVRENFIVEEDGELLYNPYVNFFVDLSDFIRAT